jgi:glycopeptide antibiotics resistance protein
VLLPVVFVRLHGLGRIAIVAFLVSLAVETIQGTLVAGRAFDIDDVILNVTGVLLAYLLVGRKVATLVRDPDR